MEGRLMEVKKEKCLKCQTPDQYFYQITCTFIHACDTVMSPRGTCCEAGGAFKKKEAIKRKM